MPTLALSMIVRDEASTLPACLVSVKDLVDEIVIADTGSKDGTVEVAKRFGARCISHSLGERLRRRPRPLPRGGAFRLDALHGRR